MNNYINMSRLKYINDIKSSDLSVSRIVDAIDRRIRDIPDFLAWHLNTPFAKKNKKKLAAFHNIHTGKRCFIIANGPSLRQTNLSLLKNEITIGMNRIYLNSSETGFTPNYIVVHDIPVQLEQFRDDYDKLTLTKFFNWNARKLFTKADNLAFIRSDFKPKFSTDLTKTSWGGHSVTNICIQLAYYMGFSEVYLVGKDHNYEQKGVPGKMLYATGDEKNHFASGYYKKGMGWRIPDYKGEELAYRMAQECFIKTGRKIFDATVKGRLQIFPKIDYYSLFQESIGRPVF